MMDFSCLMFALAVVWMVGVDGRKGGGGLSSQPTLEEKLVLVFNLFDLNQLTI